MSDQDTFPGGNYPRTLSLEWIDDDLFLNTRAVWEEHIGRPIPDEEVIEILVNTKHFASVLIKAAREMKKDEATDHPES